MSLQMQPDLGMPALAELAEQTAQAWPGGLTARPWEESHRQSWSCHLQGQDPIPACLRELILGGRTPKFDSAQQHWSDTTMDESQQH